MHEGSGFSLEFSGQYFLAFFSTEPVLAEPCSIEDGLNSSIVPVR